MALLSAAFGRDLSASEARSEAEPSEGQRNGGRVAKRYLRIRLRAASRDAIERASAEAMEVGALGLEELDDGSAWLYAPEAAGAALAAMLARFPQHELTVGPQEPLPDVAWSEAWKHGLDAVVVSPRLVVRPPFVPRPADHRGADIVIDPGQAFGTGAHATTFLALALLCEVPLEGARVLDVGCGSGVLGLAALALGAREAVACDLDPLATAATLTAARANGLRAGLRVFRGSVDALEADARFDVVIANLIRRELLPLLPGLALHARLGGLVLLSGLLEREGHELRGALSAHGLTLEHSQARREPAGGDRWLALRARRG